MSTTEFSPRQKAALLLGTMVLLAVIIAVGLLLREHGPGNMGTGFLQGAGFGLVAVLVVTWRVTRNPEGATSFERAFTQQGDERDDLVLTRALAVLGLLSVPMTGAAAVAVGLGAEVSVALGLLLFALLGVGVVAYVLIARRT